MEADLGITPISVILAQKLKHMILDKIENAELYFGLSERLMKGLKYLKATNFSALEPGKYVLDGELLYAMVNEYETKVAGSCKLESHQKYIDIQFMLEGDEQVGFLPEAGQVPTEPYNATKDVQFYDEVVHFFPFRKGQFAIFYPTDLHQPGVTLSAKCSVRKVVVKVAV